MQNRYRSRSSSFSLTMIHPRNRGMFISVVFLGAIIAAFLLAFVAFGNDVDENPTSLQLVVILHRHGDRTPTKLYENDPYKDVKKYWPLGMGQLTLVGKQQLYKLGQTFRNRYKSFVSKFDVEAIRVDSSNIDRTLMSAEVLLAGWFPPQDDQIWNNNLIWQPIPVHTLLREHDKIIALRAPCPKYDEIKSQVMKQFKENQTDIDKEFFRYVTKHAGQKFDNVRDAESMYSTLFIEELNGHKLPEWTETIFPEPMKFKASVGMASHAWNTEMQRLHGGSFINELLNQFHDKSKGKKVEKKLHLYSGHDITMVVVWRTLGFDELILPSFGASFIWELHKYSDNYYVKMFYMNDTSLTEPYELQIPRCEQPCPLKALFEITEVVRPVDWDKECQLS